MNIAIYYEQRGYGGVDTHMALLINNWPCGDDRFIVLSNPGNEGLEYLKSKIRRQNVEIHQINNGVFSTINMNNNKLYKLLTLVKTQCLFLMKFPKILRGIDPDIFISDNGGYPGAPTSFIAAIIGQLIRSTRDKTFLLLHHAPCGNYFIRINADIFSVLIRLLSIRIITVSEASKRILESTTPLKNMKVIHNGLEIPSDTLEPMELKQQFNISPDKIIVGMIGPIDPHKGHATIIEVFKCSKILQQNTHFVVVGKGNKNLVAALKSKVHNYGLSKNFTFTGFLSGDSLNIIAAFDILVMPTTDFEGFGYSMAEAMSIGVPVVASAVGAIPEVIVNGESGFLMKPDDIEGWQNRLEALVQNSNQRVVIGMQGRKRVKENFSAIKMAQEYTNVLTCS